MRNWLIKLLGGRTGEEWAIACNDLKQFTVDRCFHIQKISELEQKLVEAQKNDNRDAKGRFTKGKPDA